MVVHKGKQRAPSYTRPTGEVGLQGRRRCAMIAGLAMLSLGLAGVVMVLVAPDRDVEAETAESHNWDTPGG